LRSFGEEERALADLATIARLDPQGTTALLDSASIHHGWSRWQEAVVAATMLMFRDVYGG